MRWLFVGEALVLRKEQRILVFIVLKPTLAVLLQSLSGPSAYSGERLRKQHLPSAELRDGKRLAVLRLNYTGSAAAQPLLGTGN